jgi:carbamoyltransferase
MIHLTDDGMKLNDEYFLPFGSTQGLVINNRGEVEVERHYSDKVIELFGAPRDPEAEISQRDMDLAWAMQRTFEKAYFHMLNLCHRLVPSERVAMAGGCVLNSVANGKMFQTTPFRQTWIQPAAGDEGLALGSSLYVSRSVLHETQRYVMGDSYLGPSYEDDAIQRELEARGLTAERLDSDALVDAVAEEMAQGNVVGWFQGRMEWGPRALGNRSIVVHPGLPNMKDILNARIKRREFFRPFAPAVLAERQSEIFDYDHPSPFMVHVYKIRPEWRERLCAVNHVDNTGRLQTVERSENPLYYDLIRAFERKTGIPVILNTSFNENEPVVCTPAEAIDCFLRTKMDVLAIGPYLCRKAPAAVA